MDIDYAFIRSQLGSVKSDSISKLKRWLPVAMQMSYRSRFWPANILEIQTHGFTYLFDFSSGAGINNRHDRVIGVYGLSQNGSGPRDESRMKGFLGGGLMISGMKYDKGHLASHGQGGFEDGLNLIPQRADINRGYKCGDPRYREMENFCANNPGTFFFSRMIYSDDTWVPTQIEYGILRRPDELAIVQFPN